jgi:hypothetical protein
VKFPKAAGILNCVYVQYSNFQAPKCMVPKFPSLKNFHFYFGQEERGFWPWKPLLSEVGRDTVQLNFLYILLFLCFTNRWQINLKCFHTRSYGMSLTHCHAKHEVLTFVSRVLFTYFFSYVHHHMG